MQKVLHCGASLGRGCRELRNSLGLCPGWEPQSQTSLGHIQPVLPLWEAVQQPLHLLETSAVTSPSPASNHLPLSPPTTLISSGAQAEETKLKKAHCGKFLLSATYTYPKAKESKSSANWKRSGKNISHNPRNYPVTQASLYHLGKPTISKGQIVSCSPLRKILSAPVDFSELQTLGKETGAAGVTCECF